MESTCCWWEY